MEQRLKVRHEIGFGSAVADNALHFTADDIESGDQGLRAVADIFELAPLHFSGFHGQRGGGALQRLNAGHLIDGNSADALRSRRGRFEIGGANAGAFGFEIRVRLWGQPIADTMGLKR